MKKLTFAISLLIGINFIVNAQNTATTSGYSNLTYNSVTFSGSCSGSTIEYSGFVYGYSSSVSIDDPINRVAPLLIC